MRTGLISMVAMLLAATWTTQEAAAALDLNPGDPAPAFTLRQLDGKQQTSLKELQGRIVVLIFGELYHDRSLEACRLLKQALKSDRLKDAKVEGVLIVTKNAQGTDATSPERSAVLPKLTLSDADRDAFEAYQVAVLPTVVVIDEEGKIVHAIAAMTSSFADTLSDALLLAAGEISRDEFEARRKPEARVIDERSVRAERLTRLAGQLARRGLMPMAETKYAEAIEVSPEHAAAHLGLGMLLLRRKRLAEAETCFRKALEIEPDSKEAALGLAYVQMTRGGDELTQAENTVRGVLKASPAMPRAHFLMGLIYEKREEAGLAAQHFKKAAQLLLEESERGELP